LDAHQWIDGDAQGVRTFGLDLLGHRDGTGGEHGVAGVGGAFAGAGVDLVVAAVAALVPRSVAGDAESVGELGVGGQARTGAHVEGDGVRRADRERAAVREGPPDLRRGGQVRREGDRDVVGFGGHAGAAGDRVGDFRVIGDDDLGSVRVGGQPVGDHRVGDVDVTAVGHGEFVRKVRAGGDRAAGRVVADLGHRHTVGGAVVVHGGVGVVRVGQRGAVTVDIGTGHGGVHSVGGVAGHALARCRVAPGQVGGYVAAGVQGVASGDFDADRLLRIGRILPVGLVGPGEGEPQPLDLGRGHTGG